MGTAIALSNTGKAVVPEHLRKLNETGNIEDRASTNTLSYGGKVWAMTLGEDKHKLMRVDPDTGDEVPRPIIKVMILGYGKDRGRTYYEGTYDPDNVSAPDCWSNDGKAPDPSVENPPDNTKSCADCPMAIKGSRVSDNGKEVVACSQHRMLAVLPVTKGMAIKTPLRMKIAVTSDWDKDNKEAQAKNWFGFTQYIRSLKNSGITHTAAVITKLRFDGDVAYPKVQFAADSWAEEDQSEVAMPLVDSDEVNALLNGSWSAPKKEAPKSLPKGEDDDGDDDEVEVAPAKPAKKAPAKKAAPKKEPEPETEDDEDDDGDLDQFATEATTVVEGEAETDDDDIAPPPKKAAPKKAAPKKAEPKKAEPKDDSVDDLLGDWDD